MKKSAVILIAVTVILLLINLIPGGKIAGNDTYYRDLEYLSLYNAGGNSIGVTAKDGGAILNTNHAMLKLLSLFCFPAASGYILTAVYLIILITAFCLILKFAKNYEIYAAAAFVLFLFTKERFMYLCTILPQGGMFAFFTLTASLMLYIFTKKDYKNYLPVIAAVSALIFACYDNVTALCAVVFGILLAYSAYIGEKKYVNLACGAAVVVLSFVFAFSYKGVTYIENVESGMANGISAYSDGTAVQTYSGLAAFYKNHPAAFADHMQKVTDNAFYNPPETPFSLWGFVKSKVMPVKLAIFAALFAIIIAFLIINGKKNKAYFAAPIGGAFVISLISMIATGIIYGISELNIRLFGFNLAFDFGFGALVVYIIYIAASRDKGLKEKYGITQ